MTLPNLEKIETSVVLLSGVDATVNLSADAISKIMRDPTGQAIGQPPIQVEITSLKDQVLVRIAGGKYVFEDKSDAAPVTGRLPDIVYGFVSLLRDQGVNVFRAYGFNFDVAFDARGDAPASEVIADRYLNRDALSSRGNISVRGAGLRLFFDHSSGARCDLKVEPRLGEVNSPTFFAHINYHYDSPEGAMPPLETLKTAYLGLWPQFVELLDKLFVKA